MTHTPGNDTLPSFSETAVLCLLRVQGRAWRRASGVISLPRSAVRKARTEAPSGPGEAPSGPAPSAEVPALSRE